MEIHNYFKAVPSSPDDGFLEVSELSLDVGFTIGNVPCPITDRESDVVQPDSIRGHSREEREARSQTVPTPPERSL